jgi:hypothetical protein
MVVLHVHICPTHGVPTLQRLALALSTSHRKVRVQKWRPTVAKIPDHEWNDRIGEGIVMSGGLSASETLLAPSGDLGSTALVAWTVGFVNGIHLAGKNADYAAAARGYAEQVIADALANGIGEEVEVLFRNFIDKTIDLAEQHRKDLEAL